MNNHYVEDKSAYLDIANHPDVKEFINACEYIREPSENEIEEIKKCFTKVMPKGDYPDNIIGLDANFYEAKVREEIPFTNFGFVKVSNILLKKKDIEDIVDDKFLNPFEVAKMQKNNESHIFVFPSSNILYKNNDSVRDGFRLRMEELFDEIKSFDNDENTSLLQTLFWLNENRKGYGGKNGIKISNCPNYNCNGKNLEYLNIKSRQYCPYCNKPIFATDCLRIWEEISEDAASNLSSLSRFSNVIKSIFLAHFIRTIRLRSKETCLKALSGMMFVINGPLAVFGNPAWVHGSLMKIIFEINEELEKAGLDKMMVIGMHNSSEVLSYANYLCKYLEPNSLLSVSDEFRNKYITFARKESSTTFGAETYYGQDFIYKTSSGKIKVFSIPYPFKGKEDLQMFKIEKSNIDNYKDINRYLKFIEDFDCDLFDNAVIPSLLAKKYSVINLQPGSKVLDLLSQIGLKK